MKRRATLTFQLEVDLDPVPGPMHDYRSVVAYVRAMGVNSMSNYKPLLTLSAVSIDGESVNIKPFKVGDKVRRADAKFDRMTYTITDEADADGKVKIDISEARVPSEWFVHSGE